MSSVVDVVVLQWLIPARLSTKIIPTGPSSASSGRRGRHDHAPLGLPLPNQIRARAGRSSTCGGREHALDPIGWAGCRAELIALVFLCGGCSYEPGGRGSWIRTPSRCGAGCTPPARRNLIAEETASGIREIGRECRIHARTLHPCRYRIGKSQHEGAWAAWYAREVQAGIAGACGHVGHR